MFGKLMVTIFVLVWGIAVALQSFVRSQTHISVVDGVLNTSGKALGLRIKPNEDLPIVARLLPGEFAEETSRGERWVHITRGGQQYSVSMKFVAMEYVRVAGLIVVKRSTYDRVLSFGKKYYAWTFYASGIGFICIILHLLLSSRIFSKSLRGRLPFTKFLVLTEERLREELREARLAESVRLGEAHTSQVSTVKFDLESRHQQALKRCIRQTREECEENFTKRERLLKQDYEQALQSSIKTEIAKVKKDVKAGLIEEFMQVIEPELNIEYTGDMGKMATSVNKICAAWKEKKRLAKILGVDLDDKDINNIANGRLFELYCAHRFNRHPNIHIKRWTPDKGINEKIKVGNNGDPDFLLEISQYGQVSLVAIECKYATPWAWKKGETKDKLNWVKERHLERYMEFEEQESVSTHILVGTGVDPENPTTLHMSDLHCIKERFKFRKRKDYRNYYNALDLIEDLKIEKDAMCDLIIKLSKAPLPSA